MSTVNRESELINYPRVSLFRRLQGRDGMVPGRDSFRLLMFSSLAGLLLVVSTRLVVGSL
jgi:hypothetical protein